MAKKKNLVRQQIKREIKDMHVAILYIDAAYHLFLEDRNVDDLLHVIELILEVHTRKPKRKRKKKDVK